MYSADEIRKNIENRTVTLPDGTSLPSIGQGTWHMGENEGHKEAEIQALQLGLNLGMTVIDTAEMYGNGGSERIVGEAIKGRREEVFLVSKVFPHNAGGGKLAAACENSLKRLGTDYLDLYLLHWRGGIPLQETVAGMEKLKKEGKILRWGVSNFDTKDMEELWQTESSTPCMTNQVLYNLGSRGIEYDLLPWQREHQITTMAYCPLAQGGGTLRKQMKNDPDINKVAENHQVTPMQIALAWSIRNGDVLSIPKAVQEQHIYDNAAAAAIELHEEELKILDRVFSPPRKKMPLDIV
ncbi:aldo/keto reductase [Salibacterium salarium]|uniref:Aldo/keto reductase n=1 Tax=Salibacterium salarium TaxID=284579 RepID=A0A3R9QJY3_9BACI|nr:aldo/keto reductase [Salibacterium salarium]RSL32382.1 aldo/keto reductase [Salibacterium salarium]